MAFTYDPTTARGQVRLLIGDTDTATTANQLFSDAEVDALLLLNNNVVRLGAAAAAEAIAMSQVMILKVIQVNGLSTNGAAVADAMRAMAAEWRRQYNEGEDGDPTGLVDYAEVVTTPFAARERIWNQALRGLLG